MAGSGVHQATWTRGLPVPFKFRTSREAGLMVFVLTALGSGEKFEGEESSQQKYGGDNQSGKHVDMHTE